MAKMGFVNEQKGLNTEEKLRENIKNIRNRRFRFEVLILLLIPTLTSSLR